jgi:hypothetical protein
MSKWGCQYGFYENFGRPDPEFAPVPTWLRSGPVEAFVGAVTASVDHHVTDARTLTFEPVALVRRLSSRFF